MPQPRVLTSLAWLKGKSLDFSGATSSTPCRKQKVLGGYGKYREPFLRRKILWKLQRKGYRDLCGLLVCSPSLLGVLPFRPCDGHRWGHLPAVLVWTGWEAATCISTRIWGPANGAHRGLDHMTMQLEPFLGATPQHATVAHSPPSFLLQPPTSEHPRGQGHLSSAAPQQQEHGGALLRRQPSSEQSPRATPLIFAVPGDPQCSLSHCCRHWSGTRMGVQGLRHP